MTKAVYLPIVALAALLFISAPGLAEEPATPAPAPAATAAHTPDTDEHMPITLGPGMEDFETLKGPEREKKFSELRDKIKNMSPEEREEWRKKRKEWFNSLTPEQKTAIKDKIQKHRRMRLDRMVGEMPQQCQAIVQKCLAEHGDDLPPPRHFKKMDGEKKQ